jgi:hypothetical protein
MPGTLAADRDKTSSAARRSSGVRVSLGRRRTTCAITRRPFFSAAAVFAVAAAKHGRAAGVRQRACVSHREVPSSDRAGRGADRQAASSCLGALPPVCHALHAGAVHAVRQAVANLAGDRRRANAAAPLQRSSTAVRAQNISAPHRGAATAAASGWGAVLPASPLETTSPDSRR